MDTTNLGANGPTPVADGQTDLANGDQESISTERNAVPPHVHQKALSQRARLKEQVEEMSSKLERYEQTKLEEQGKHTEVIASLRKQNQDYLDKMQKMENAYRDTVISNQVITEFANRDIKEPEMAWDLARARFHEDLKTVEVDENYRVNRDDLSRFADQFLTKCASWNLRATKSPDDLVPNNTVPGNKSTSEMSNAELIQAWAQAKQ